MMAKKNIINIIAIIAKKNIIDKLHKKTKAPYILILPTIKILFLEKYSALRKSISSYIP